MAHVFEGGNPTHLTASGNISSGPCTLLGFYVASTTSGTVIIKDGATALSGTITPAVGFHRFPASIGTNAVATIANTLDVTFFYSPAL